MAPLILGNPSPPILGRLEAELEFDGTVECMWRRGKWGSNLVATFQEDLAGFRVKGFRV